MQWGGDGVHSRAERMSKNAAREERRVVRSDELAVELAVQAGWAGGRDRCGAPAQPRLLWLELQLESDGARPGLRRRVHDAVLGRSIVARHESRAEEPATHRRRCNSIRVASLSCGFPCSFTSSPSQCLIPRWSQSHSPSIHSERRARFTFPLNRSRRPTRRPTAP